jgi:thiol-disulfide isomerase/thioredoxin
MSRSSVRLSLLLFGLVVAIAAGFLAVIVIGESGTPSSSNGTVSVSASSLPTPTPLRAFTATDSTGQAIGSATIKGPTVIHIYASWCPTCRAEAKHFAAFLRANPAITPIYIAVADQPASAARFITASGWRPGPIIDDPKRTLATALGLSGQPNTIFVNRAAQTETLRGGAGLATLDRYGHFATA